MITSVKCDFPSSLLKSDIPDIKLQEELFSRYGTTLVNLTDKSESNVLHYASGEGRLSVVKWLIEKIGINEKSINSKGRTPLHLSARYGHIALCKYFIEEMNVPVDVKADSAVTPFHLSCWQGHLEVAMYLLASGAQVDQVNEFGCGTAHWIGLCPVFNQNNISSISREIEDSVLRLCRELHNRGVPFIKGNNQGHTPMHKAAYAGNYVVCEFLINELHQMDDVRDHGGNLAADSAERTGQVWLSRWLRRMASSEMRFAFSDLNLSFEKKYNKNQIHSAYLETVRVIHPDKLNGSHDLFRKTQQQYELLSLTTTEEETTDEHLVGNLSQIRNQLNGCEKEMSAAINSLLPKTLELHRRNHHHSSLKLLKYNSQKSISKDTAETTNKNWFVGDEGCERSRQLAGCLDQFAAHLTSLLNNEFKNDGVDASRLSRQLQKSFQAAAIDIKIFGERRLTGLLRRMPHVVSVVLDSSGTALLYPPCDLTENDVFVVSERGGKNKGTFKIQKK